MKDTICDRCRFKFDTEMEDGFSNIEPGHLFYCAACTREDYLVMGMEDVSRSEGDMIPRIAIRDFRDTHTIITALHLLADSAIEVMSTHGKEASNGRDYETAMQTNIDMISFTQYMTGLIDEIGKGENASEKKEDSNTS